MMAALAKWPIAIPGSLAIFESAAVEALRDLDALGLDARGLEFKHEASELVTVFRVWRLQNPQDDEDRVAAIVRVIALSKNVTQYLAEVRRRLR